MHWSRLIECAIFWSLHGVYEQAKLVVGAWRHLMWQQGNNVHWFAKTSVPSAHKQDETSADVIVSHQATPGIKPNYTHERHTPRFSFPGVQELNCFGRCGKKLSLRVSNKQSERLSRSDSRNSQALMASKIDCLHFRCRFRRSLLRIPLIDLVENVLRVLYW